VVALSAAADAWFVRASHQDQAEYDDRTDYRDTDPNRQGVAAAHAAEFAAARRHLGVTGCGTGLAVTRRSVGSIAFPPGSRSGRETVIQKVGGLLPRRDRLKGPCSSTAINRRQSRCEAPTKRLSRVSV